MSLILGEAKASKLYLGDKEIKKAYLGDTLVYKQEEGQNQPRLPEGYTEVEYIQSHDYAYIDTLKKPTSTFKFVIDIEPIVAASSTEKYIAYSFYQLNTTSKYTFSLKWGSSGIRVATGLYSSTVTNKTLTSSTEIKRRKITVDYANKKAFVDDENAVILSSVVIHSNMPTITLCGIKNGTANTALESKVYSCQIYDVDDAVRNFVPCIDPSGAVGLYDLVNSKFYSGSGTGSFSAGPSI